MVLADFQLPPRIAIPASMRKAARSPQIEVTRLDSPLWGADDWIACSQTWPHFDTQFEGQLFLTLSVVSEHEAGDALAPRPMHDVPVGRLFVVDPMTCHWLAPEDAWMRARQRPWIGVQWKVDKRNAKALARKLVTEHGGRWLHSDDKRYRSWRP